MGEVRLLSRLKQSLVRNRFLSGFRGSRFREVVILGSALIFWIGLFLLFYQGFTFLARFEAFEEQVVRVVMNLLFLSLVLMLCFSNGIIAYVSLFQSDETTFLMSSPLQPGSIYLYKLTETLTFSSWAFLFLAAPLIIAYGVTAGETGAPLYYYPLTGLLILSLIFIPAAVGSVVALLLARWGPSKRSSIILLFVTVGTIILAVGGGLLYSLAPAGGDYTREWLSSILDQLSFAHHPLLPSAWAASGMILFGRGELAEGGFYLLLLLSNGLMGILGAFYVSEWVFAGAWRRSRSGSGERNVRGGHVRDFILHAICRLFPGYARTLLRKDVLSFLRDPAQWMQFLIFFGLLGIYFFNLRELNMQMEEEWWRLIISFLNLGATGLTLASFTSRFIYPQISLEGRRFWIVGMAPVERRSLIQSKFFYSLFFTTIVSVPLVALSVYMLRLTGTYIVLEIAVISGICIGLSALAVGLGTMYPDFSSDDPSKIVSGFGGTLNLVLSLTYVMLLLIIGAIPVYVETLYGAGVLGLGYWELFGRFFALGIAVVTLFTVIPLLLGIRSFERIEI